KRGSMRRLRRVKNSQPPTPNSQKGNLIDRGFRLQAEVRRLVGLDTRADEYAYAIDPVSGYVSAQKVPDKWIKTTCGYCSVGCGMFIGVKDGRAVAVRGNPDHPVSRGLLCPKGLSEHHTIDAANRARYPLLRRNGQMTRVSWPEALETMAMRIRDVQAQYGHQ